MFIETTELLGRLNDHDLDRPGTTDTFSRRLAREHGWSKDYGARVIAEYKRFLVLARTAEEPSSPSDAVDQAWHLHLLYTRDYRRFCQNLLGRRLDHTPSAGGGDERKKFEAAYARTLERYREAFSEEPPSDIWPGVEQRRRRRGDFVRLDLEANWVIRKPRFLSVLSARLPESFFERRTLAALGGALAMGCATSGAAAWHISGPTFLRYFLFGWLASLTVALIAKQGISLPWQSKSKSQPELDAYEVAYLAGKGLAAVDAAIAMLVATGAASFDRQAGTLLAAAPIAPGAHELESRLHAGLSLETPRDLRSIRAEAETSSAKIRERLGDLGLIAEPGSRLPLAIALAAPIVGFLRILSRIGTHRPLAILILLSLLGAVIAFVFFTPTFRTRQGEVLLRGLKRYHASLSKAHEASDLLAQGALPLTVGLFGLGMLASNPLGGVHSGISRPKGDGSPSECSGGCSGGCSSGCGGGCGCGGCGGCG